MNIYGNEEAHEWFLKAYEASGKKLNMGKSCVRLKKIEDLPLDVIAKAVSRVTVDEFVRIYRESREKGKQIPVRGRSK